MTDVAEAQGGIESLVNWTNLSPQTLTYLLNTEHPPQLGKVLDILSMLKGSRHSKHDVMENTLSVLATTDINRFPPLRGLGL